MDKPGIKRSKISRFITLCFVIMIAVIVLYMIFWDFYATWKNYQKYAEESALNVTGMVEEKLDLTDFKELALPSGKAKYNEIRELMLAMCRSGYIDYLYVYTIDPDVIKHYAKADIENLRLCSIDPPEASGQFLEFLSGKKVICHV